MEKVLIIIPCYNEENRLDASSFEKYLQSNRCVDFLFVDDGSTDETWNIVSSIKSMIPKKIYLSSNKFNSGKGEAIRSGFLWGFKKNYSYIGYFDADLSTPLSEIFNLCQVFEQKPNIEIVSGARVNLVGRNIQRSKIRAISSTIFSTVTFVLLRLPYYDTQCGAKIFKRTSELESTLQMQFITKWLFDIEIYLRLNMEKKKLHKPDLYDVSFEYPLNEWIDTMESKIIFTTYFVCFFQLILLAFNKKMQEVQFYFKKN